MPSSTALSASVTGVRSGLLITCRSSALNRAVVERVGVVGEHVGEPQVVGVVGGMGQAASAHRLCRTGGSASVNALRDRMEINGLPLHPLVVHAAVVFVPLAALAAIALRCVPRWRWLAALADASCSRSCAVRGRSWRPYLTGDDFLEHAGRRCEPARSCTTHQQRGQLLRWVALAFAVVAVVAVLWRARRRWPAPAAGERGAAPAVADVVAVLAVLLAVAVAGAASCSPATPAPGRSGAEPGLSTPVGLAAGEQPPERLAPGRGRRRRRRPPRRARTPARPSPWVQPRGQSSVSSSRSGNASIRCSGWTCASPNDRMPGVSMIQPPPSGSAQHAAPRSRCAGRGR